MKIYENYSLLRHNTFRLDVKTRWFVEYESESDLQKLLQDEYFFSQTFWHIGQGSNLLFLNDFGGIIVHSGIKGVETMREDKQHLWLKVGAAEDWDGFVAYCVEQGWGGLENLSLIPGEVGSSAVQNIGAYGVEAAERIEEVHAYSLKTGEKRIFSTDECRYAYRHSIFKEDDHRGLYYITHVVYRLDKRPTYRLDYGNVAAALDSKEINLKNVRATIIAIRRSKLPDPDVEGNAGSFFMNPYLCIAHYESLKKHFPDIPHYPVNDAVVKVPAAWLIEQCGWKGKSWGGAAVSERQPLVLVNRNHATGQEIAELSEKIRQSVKDTFGVELKTEVNFI